MTAPYKSSIDKLIAQARENADKHSERDSDLAGQRADALEAFADALEAAYDELEADWEA